MNVFGRIGAWVLHLIAAVFRAAAAKWVKTSAIFMIDIAGGIARVRGSLATIDAVSGGFGHSIMGIVHITIDRIGAAMAAMFKRTSDEPGGLVAGSISAARRRELSLARHALATARMFVERIARLGNRDYMMTNRLPVGAAA